ncbi:MAG: hypothetical protein LAP85_24860 [Acidobacteriia bacterium]|nr:hypothetical protein [Terriglobia bacterium]
MKPRKLLAKAISSPANLRFSEDGAQHAEPLHSIVDGEVEFVAFGSCAKLQDAVEALRVDRCGKKMGIFLMISLAASRRSLRRQPDDIKAPHIESGSLAERTRTSRGKAWRGVIDVGSISVAFYFSDQQP